MTQLSDYAEQQVVNHFLRNQAFTPPTTVYLALFSDATTDAGGGTEATGGSYARQAITFGAPSSGAASNTNALTFTNMPAGTWTHCAIIDASSGGNFLFHGPLTASKTTTAGQNVEVAVGEIDADFTAASNATNYLRHAVLNAFLRNSAFTPPATIYLGLYEDATTVAGGGTEISGGSYSRQAEAFIAPTGGVTSNSADISFTDVPTTPVTDAALLDASSAGNMLLYGTLNATIDPDAGDTIRFQTGTHTLTVR
jgi:hypothetical protein